jgi:tetratricopeptide (TPR) repeat protein
MLPLAMCACTVFVYGFSSNPYFSEADRAEALWGEGKKEEAIEAYEAHIQNRMKRKKRLPNENPYFYKLMIGDIYLELDKAEEAEKAYLVAHEKKVSPPLCADRLRKIGRYYEERKEYEKAFEILRKHRELDSLLFDLEIDRLHKSLVNSKKKQVESEPN